MKKLTTGKIWQFAAGQFGWAMLSGIISNWLVYFYQPDKTAIRQGQVCANGIAAIGQGHNVFSNTLILAVFPELYAIVALAATFLIGSALVA